MADFITKLPVVQEYDSILVVVDQFTKMAHFVPMTEKTMAEELARLFRDNVWQLHGLPESIISDRGPQFVAGLMRELNEMLGIKTKLSTAFHPLWGWKTKDFLWDSDLCQNHKFRHQLCTKEFKNSREGKSRSGKGY